MIRIVEVITALERGGAQRVVLESAAHLHGAMFDVHVVSAPGGALADEARTRLGARWHVIPELRNPLGLLDVAALFALARLLERLRRDAPGPMIVHTHGSKAGVLGRLAASALPGTAILHTVHGFGLDALGPRARPFLRFAEAVAGRVTDTLIFVSEHDLAEAGALGLTPRGGTRIIRAGVPPSPPAPVGTSDPHARAHVARTALGLPRDIPLALTVANMKEQKDPLFHVEVLAAWRARRPDAALVFLGDGPLRTAMRERARALGVADALYTPGFVEDPAPYYAAAEVFLLASRWEGLPCAALEAIAAGLPLVVRHGGWADELSFCDALYRFSPSADAAALAAGLDDAWVGGRHDTPLPSAFTRDGMLDALIALYQESASAVNRRA